MQKTALTLWALTFTLILPTKTLATRSYTTLSPRPNATFAGSSTIALWDSLARDFPEWFTLNLGKGGTTYDDLVRQYSHWLQPALDSSDLVFLYSGDNDLAEKQTPAAVLENLRTLVDRIRRDRVDAQIWVLTVKVSPARLQLRPQIEALNALIRAEALQTQNFGIVETEHALSNAAHLPLREYFARDGLHLSPSGYAIWRKQIRQAVLGE